MKFKTMDLRAVLAEHRWRFDNEAGYLTAWTWRHRREVGCLECGRMSDPDDSCNDCRAERTGAEKPRTEAELLREEEPNQLPMWALIQKAAR